MAKRIALVIAAALVLAAPASASYPGRNGKIAFDAVGDIWVMGHDGSGARAIVESSVEGEYYNDGPAFSPDGSVVGYIRDEWGQYRSDLFTVRPNGDDVRRVTDMPADFSILDPSWSPDGGRLVVTGGDYGGADPDQLYVLNADGTGLTQITDTPVDSYSPSWGPASVDRILFTHGRFESGHVALRTVDPNGTGGASITTATETVYRTDWKPDGRRIAYAENGAVYSIELDGTGRKRLAGSSYGATDVAWSPDGKRIAFDASKGKGYAIYKMHADGSHKKELVRSKQTLLDEPDWQTLPPRD